MNERLIRANSPKTSLGLTVFEVETGIPESAAEKKCYANTWKAGTHYIIGPDGKRYYKMSAIHRWILEGK